MSNKQIKSLTALTLVCVYEITRQTGKGPTFDELFSLLKAVYGFKTLTENELKEKVSSLSRNHIQRDDQDGRYYPLIAGVFLFGLIQDRVIPPQTVTIIQRGNM